GDYAAVRVVAREVDAEAVDDAWTQYRIGEAFAATGASEAALRPFRRAVALAPHALRFRVKLAGALVATGAVEEAVRAYDAVLEADPTFETAYNDRGWARVLL